MPSRFVDGVLESENRCEPENVFLDDLFTEVFTKTGGKTAAVDALTGESYSYSELLERCQQIAVYLQDSGVKAGDSVVFSAVNSLDSLCTVLALTFCHVRLILTKISCTAYELKQLLDPLDVHHIIGDDETFAKLSAYGEGRQIKVNIFKNDQIAQSKATRTFERSDRHEKPEETIFCILFTSGSTGPSKAICASHKNVVAGLSTVKAGLENNLMTNPIVHASGLITTMRALVSGGTLFIASEYIKQDVELFKATLKRWQIQTVLLFPAFLTKCIKAHEDFAESFASVKIIATGGSVLAQSTATEFKKVFPGIMLVQVYASSETMSVILGSRNIDDINGLDVLDNVDAKIVDVKTGETIETQGVPGELALRSPTNAMGYLNNPKATAETFIGEWVMTGDLAKIENDRVYILDRIKQLIKCMDIAVVPADIEAILNEDPVVLQSLVVGIPHKDLGEAPTAFVTLVEGQNDYEGVRHRLTSSVEQRCAAYKRLQGGVFFLSGFPETDSGKLSRRDVRDLHLQGKLSYVVE